MDDYVDILIANLKVLASVPNSGRLAVRRGQLSVDTCIHGQCILRFWYGDSRESTIHHVKNTVAGVIRTSDDIMHITGLPKWKDLWNLSRIAKEMKSAEFGLQNLRSTYSSDAGTSASLQVTSERLQAHREVILRFIERLSEVEISDYDSRSTSNHTEEISKGFEETLQTYPVDLRP
jgi:hypothetical protein